MQDQTIPHVIEQIRVLFSAPHFAEDELIDFVNDEYLTLITRKQALALCKSLVDEYNPLNSLKEHIDWVTYDFIHSNMK